MRTGYPECMEKNGHWRARTDIRKLQIFVSDLSATGVVRNAIAIANEAATRGYQVRLLTCHADGELKGELGPGVALIRLNQPGDQQHSRRLQLQRAYLAYRRHCRQWKPDVMVSAGNHGHLLSTLAWLGLPGGKILRISNDLAHGSPSLPTRLWRSAKFALVAALADRLVYVSHALGQHPLLARSLATGKAVVIANGVDVEKVRHAAAAESGHRWAGDASVPLLLAVGRHVRQKNFPFLLRSFAAACALRPMRLIILGCGSSSETGQLRSITRTLGIDALVDFVPPVANPFPYMKDASALVLPSLWEGSSNVILEAMACGTPVIASTTAGDAAFVLDSGRFGVLVDPDDSDGLTQAILRQLGPDAVLPGSRAAQFSRAGAMRRYVELFGQLAGSRSHGSGQLPPMAVPASS